MKTRASIIETLTTILPDLREEFGVGSIGIFGSYSREEASEGSDLDLLYELLPGKRLGLKELEQLEEALRHKIGIHEIDLVNKQYLNPIVEDQIEEDLVYV